MKRPTASARSRQNGTYQLLTRPTPDHGAGCPDSYHETQPRVCLRDQCLVTDTAGVQPRTIASRRRTSNLGFWVFSGPLTVPLHGQATACFADLVAEAAPGGKRPLCHSPRSCGCGGGRARPGGLRSRTRYWVARRACHPARYRRVLDHLGRPRAPGRVAARSSESPMSHKLGGHKPTNSARRSALPRSSWSTVLARIHSATHSPIEPRDSDCMCQSRRPTS